MKRIDTLEDLQIEKRRLRIHRSLLEKNISLDWNNMQESLNPVNKFLNAFRNSTSGNKPNLLTETMNAGIDTFLRRIVLRNRGILLKLIIPYLVKNLTGNYIKNHRTDIFSWLRNKFNGFFSQNNSHQRFDKSTADVDYTSW